MVGREVPDGQLNDLGEHPVLSLEATDPGVQRAEDEWPDQLGGVLDLVAPHQP
jgi:hypothetical protein